MAARRRCKSTADVLETVLADSAYEDADSVKYSSTTSEYAQSSADSSAGNEDVCDGQLSVRRSKLARPSDVCGGWTDNTPEDTVNPLVFTGNSGCATPLQSEEPVPVFEQFITTDFVSDCVTETKCYAAQMSSGTGLSPFSCIRNPVDTTVF